MYTFYVVTIHDWQTKLSTQFSQYVDNRGAYVVEIYLYLYLYFKVMQGIQLNGACLVVMGNCAISLSLYLDIL